MKFEFDGKREQQNGVAPHRIQACQLASWDFW